MKKRVVDLVAVEKLAREITSLADEMYYHADGIEEVDDKEEIEARLYNIQDNLELLLAEIENLQDATKGIGE